MCYVLIDQDNWTADIGYMCEDVEGEQLKTELAETLGSKINDIIADIRQHPNLIKAVNKSVMKELQININLEPSKKTESASLDW